MSFGAFRSRLPRDYLDSLENTKKEAKEHADAKVTEMSGAFITDMRAIELETLAFAEAKVNEFSGALATEILPNLAVSGGISPAEFAALSASFNYDMRAIETETLAFAESKVNEFSGALATEILPNLTVSGGISAAEFAALSASFNYDMRAIETETLAYAEAKVNEFSGALATDVLPTLGAAGGISAVEFAALSASIAYDMAMMEQETFAYADTVVQAATGSMITSGAVDTTSLNTLSGSMAAAMAAMEMQLATQITNVPTGASTAELAGLSGSVGTEIDELFMAVTSLQDIAAKLQSRVSYNEAIIGMPEHIVLKNDMGAEYSLHVNDDGDLLFDAYTLTGSTCDRQLVSLEYLTLKAPNGQLYELSVMPNGGLTFNVSTRPTGSEC
tara:strand:- start:73884 stop:75047 length:1164 start_codon:yes stop_codon:yes gene_type:complete